MTSVALLTARGTLNRHDFCSTQNRISRRSGSDGMRRLSDSRSTGMACKDKECGKEKVKSDKKDEKKQGKVKDEAKPKW